MYSLLAALAAVSLLKGNYSFYALLFILFCFPTAMALNGNGGKIIHYAGLLTGVFFSLFLIGSVLLLTKVQQEFFLFIASLVLGILGLLNIYYLVQKK
jgi:hypothetical protein